MKKIVSDLYYTIAATDGRVLEVADFETHNGVAVQLWEYQGEDSQQWLVQEVSDGIYQMRNKLSGKALDIIDMGVTDGAWLHQWDYVGTESQHWAIEPDKKGAKIRSKLSGKVIDLVGMVSENGAHVQIWEDVDGENQHWVFTAVSGTKIDDLALEKKPVAKKAPPMEQISATKGKKPATKKASPVVHTAEPKMAVAPKASVKQSVQSEKSVKVSAAKKPGKKQQ